MIIYQEPVFIIVIMKQYELHNETNINSNNSTPKN